MASVHQKIINLIPDYTTEDGQPPSDEIIQQIQQFLTWSDEKLKEKKKSTKNQKKTDIDCCGLVWRALPKDGGGMIGGKKFSQKNHCQKKAIQCSVDGDGPNLCTTCYKKWQNRNDPDLTTWCGTQQEPNRNLILGGKTKRSRHYWIDDEVIQNAFTQNPNKDPKNKKDKKSTTEKPIPKKKQTTEKPIAEKPKKKKQTTQKPIVEKSKKKKTTEKPIAEKPKKKQTTEKPIAKKKQKQSKKPITEKPIPEQDEQTQIEIDCNTLTQTDPELQKDTTTKPAWAQPVTTQQPSLAHQVPTNELALFTPNDDEVSPVIFTSDSQKKEEEEEEAEEDEETVKDEETEDDEDDEDEEDDEDDEDEDETDEEDEEDEDDEEDETDEDDEEDETDEEDEDDDDEDDEEDEEDETDEDDE